MVDSAAFAERVIRWQRRHGRRALPWQGTRDPYRVWLSEIMLQQTQVATVLDYYGRFLQRFPDLSALAAAPLDDVLALWSGLGYYSRARNLHRCAQRVQADHGGAFPSSAAALAELPGIGRSTAAAIAAFCFGERVAILDGNVKRVLSRAHGFGDDLALASHQRRLWQMAELLLPPRNIEPYTQGLMDLGATLCIARDPRCGDCPLRADCVAYRHSRVHDYPHKTRRSVRGRRENALLWLVCGARVWLARRPDNGVWAGLWSLPEFADPQSLNAAVQGWPGRGEELSAIDHALTHFDWRLRPFRWTVPPRVGAARLRAITDVLPGGRWVDRGEALRLGLSAPVRRLLEANG